MKRPNSSHAVMTAALVMLIPFTSACEDAASRAAARGGTFHVVSNWPSLPPGHRLGEVPGVAVNSRNEILVFHRADRSWLDDTVAIPRPTILRIDAGSGEVIDSLGQNLFLNPHGLGVDRDV